MKKIIILRSDILEPDHKYYGWDAFCSHLNRMGINMLGFSEREIIIKEKNNDKVILDIKDNLVADFTLALCEASSIDYSFKII